MQVDTLLKAVREAGKAYNGVCVLDTLYKYVGETTGPDGVITPTPLFALCTGSYSLACRAGSCPRVMLCFPVRN